MALEEILKKLAAGVVATALVVIGFAVAPGAQAGLPHGPGPETHYTVQKQPAAGHCHYRSTKAHQPLPDRHCTPGALNPQVTQATIKITICKSGYTAKIRPSTAITNKEKVADASSYHYTSTLAQAEYDHLVPLELGGDPNDARNLWVEPPSPGHRRASGVHNPKDSIETAAKHLVCNGEVSLAKMQNAIAVNWTTALAAVGHPAGK
jgi:hypothetical protein